MTGSDEKVVTIRLDQDDLERRVWSCHMYPFLRRGINAQCQEVLESSIHFRVHLRRVHENDK